jgi:hypothetical protein
MITPVISFYSDVDGRTYYSDHAKRLSKNLDDLSIPHIIREKKSKGSYRSNCLSKPRFILELLNEIRKPLVWLDIDSIVHKTLDVFDNFKDNVDVGMAFPKIPTKEDPTIGIPKASPIYVNNTPKALEFLYAWIEASERIEKEQDTLFDHEILMKIFEKILKENTGIRMACLSNAYCVWPGLAVTGGEPMITMGLADGESKAESLKKMGMNEAQILFQSPGNKFLVNT